MSASLPETAPAFVEIAHHVVWATAATATATWRLLAATPVPFHT